MLCEHCPVHLRNKQTGLWTLITINILKYLEINMNEYAIECKSKCICWHRELDSRNSGTSGTPSLVLPLLMKTTHQSYAFIFGDSCWELYAWLGSSSGESDDYVCWMMISAVGLWLLPCSLDLVPWAIIMCWTEKKTRYQIKLGVLNKMTRCYLINLSYLCLKPNMNRTI